MNQAVQAAPAAKPDTATEDAQQVTRWLAAFEAALQSGDAGRLAALFTPDDCHWRDLLAFTWHITPFRGAAEIAAGLVRNQPGVQAHDFALAAKRTAPRRMSRAGNTVIEALFSFETIAGHGMGALRLPADKPGQAFQIMTSLNELRGFEEHTGLNRPTGSTYSRNFGGANWKDQRLQRQRYDRSEEHTSELQSH